MAVSDEQPTVLLQAYRAGDEQALERLLPRIYDDLKAAARAQLHKLRPGDTLNTTALVHEAYIRLMDDARVDAVDRAHFLALAARTMRFVLVDHARARSAAKRGGGQADTPLDEVQVGVENTVAKVLQVDEALERLTDHSERLGRVVECRFFGGLTYEEMAELFDCSVPTVKRDWRRARTWLHTFLRPA